MRTFHEKGVIEWGWGTGGNHEITQIKAYEQGKGIGKQLFKIYTETCDPPFYSIYAFVLGSRDGALKFYRSLGFREVNLGKSIYRDDDTVLFWIPFEELKNYDYSRKTD